MERSSASQVSFGAEAAAELYESFAVVVTMAVKELIEPGLKAALERVEELGGDEDGDDQAPFADCCGQQQVDFFGDEGDDAEVDADQCSCSQGVGYAALEDEVGVHQAIADDGPAEGQRQEDERQAGDLLKNDGNWYAGEEWKRVQQGEGQNGEQRSAGEPLKLLAEQGSVGAGVAAEEQDGGQDEIGRVVCGRNLVKTKL